VGIPGRDHANAVSSRVFRQAVVEFLDERSREDGGGTAPVVG
jgi:hypothetical protein